MHNKIIIIGSGPAGYSAAIYAARAGLEPVLIAGYQQGGQLTITTDVENYPGFARPIQGPWLMEQMKEQALSVGVKIVQSNVEKIDWHGQIFEITTDDTSYTSHTLIVATGAQAKWLGLPSEEKFKGFGVSGCATCDGFFYKNKKVAVIGGGNSAIEEALYLTNHAAEVFLIHRRDKFKAERILLDRMLHNKKITVILNSVVEEILGLEKPFVVNGIKIFNKIEEESSVLSLDGVFIAIGHKPNTDIVRGIASLDDDGYIVTEKGSTVTNVKGLFAAGDVQDKIYRQAVTAAGTGCMAALDALKYLQENNFAS